MCHAIIKCAAYKYQDMKSFLNFIREDVVKIRSGKYLLLSPGGDIMGVFDTRHAAVKRQQELDFYTHESCGEELEDRLKEQGPDRCWTGYKPTPGKKPYEKGSCIKEDEKELDEEEQFDMIEDMVESIAEEHGVDSDVIWEDLESVDDNELLETAAWRRSAGKNKKGGLNAKGVASYRRENPGSKLQMAVTTKPSKLKPGSKGAKRRKSFCARMGGVKGPMKKPNGKPTRKALALRKWNC